VVAPAHHRGMPGRVRRQRRAVLALSHRGAMDDPQLAHRHAFGEVRDSAGVFRALNPPFRFSAARASVQPYAATRGEHGNEVLAEAGYTAREIEEYRKSGVLG
jgi:crotonobetainyl-CoA:carnitine CoA-transferase CaiB-like acyl-CoA transferase